MKDNLEIKDSIFEQMNDLKEFSKSNNDDERGLKNKGQVKFDQSLNYTPILRSNDEFDGNI